MINDKEQISSIAEDSGKTSGKAEIENRKFTHAYLSQ